MITGIFIGFTTSEIRVVKGVLELIGFIVVYCGIVLTISATIIWLQDRILEGIVFARRKIWSRGRNK